MNSRAGKEYHGHKLVTLTLNYVSRADMSLGNPRNK